MAEEKQPHEKVGLAMRLRRAALFVVFAAVLLIPKTLSLRRRGWLWNSLRLVAAIVGAALLTEMKDGSAVGLHSAVGLLLILLAVLLRPAREGKSVDEQARELGALVVLNGGRFSAAGEKQVQARLFVAPERVHVLDLQHRPLLEIPLATVLSVRVEEEDEAKEAKEAKEQGGWRLVVEWQQGVAVFHYQGFFAEHVARIAETTVQGQLKRELPVVR